ncbi:YmaF family protein [Bacillus smithii]|uniref:YmaF family protein n=1 Tax=Bacillus smithii TaxID=1479 RepID=UPI003D1E044F
MEIPVTGYIVHSSDSDSDHSHVLYLTIWDGRPLDSDSDHSHVLYLTIWDGRPLHKHHFSGVTSFNVGHEHRYAGTTEPAPSGVPHTHKYFAITSLNDGHKHEIRGVTGPAIPLPEGGHYHNFHGVTTINGSHPHSHKYSGKTSPSD